MKDLVKDLALAKNYTGRLYQIGLPVNKLSSVMMFWSTQQMPTMVIHKSNKTENYCVIEIRNDLLANAIISNVSEARINIVKDNKERIIKI